MPSPKIRQKKKAITFFQKSTPSNSPQKTQIVGYDLLVIETITSPRIKVLLDFSAGGSAVFREAFSVAKHLYHQGIESFTRTFSKVRAGQGRFWRSQNPTLFARQIVCAHRKQQQNRRLMAIFCVIKTRLSFKESLKSHCH